MGDVIVHRAILDDITGIPKLLDWLSDGDIVILEMSRLITVETELRIAVDRIQSFVESDLSGEVIRLGTSKIVCHQHLLYPRHKILLIEVENWKVLLNTLVQFVIQQGLTLSVHTSEIAYFGEHTEMTIICNQCGWRNTDFIPSEGKQTECLVTYYR